MTHLHDLPTFERTRGLRPEPVQMYDDLVEQAKMTGHPSCVNVSKCSDCNGTGRDNVPYGERCDLCHGTGEPQRPGCVLVPDLGYAEVHSISGPGLPSEPEIRAFEAAAKDIIGRIGSRPSGRSLKEAKPTYVGVDPLEAIKHDRRKVYGEPRENHKGIAQMWAPMLQPWAPQIARGEPIPEHVVALLMALLKIDRMRLVYHKDNYDDCKNYLDFAEDWQADPETPIPEQCR